jgi:hypothetical protein
MRRVRTRGSKVCGFGFRNFRTMRTLTSFPRYEDGEVTYIRSIDDGRFVLGVFRMPAGDEMTPEKLKETIAESVTNRGGDADDIEFDTAAEDFAELLSYPCLTLSTQSARTGTQKNSR